MPNGISFIFVLFWYENFQLEFVGFCVGWSEAKHRIITEQSECNFEKAKEMNDCGV